MPDLNSEAVAKSIFRFYSKNYSLDLLEKVIEEYIKSIPVESIQIQEFAIANAKYRDRVIEREQADIELKRLMQETKERMQGFTDEL